MIGKLIILCVVLVTLWASISRIGRTLGIGPLKPAKPTKPPKPLFTLAGFKISKSGAVIASLIVLYAIWALTQLV